MSVQTGVEVRRPGDLAAARDAITEGGRLSIAGAGTAGGWAGRLGPIDAVLDTTALSGVLVHNPSDMTVAVLAGTPLRDLGDVVAGHGQRVSLDAARVAEGATVGGLIATADAGPLAQVHGSLRDLVIGATIVLADGTIARTGGHVIKNVAGYDLTKLLHGSFGTLALLVEVVLRLHPVPERTATVALPCRLADAAAQAGAVLASPLEPVALEWCPEPDGDHSGGGESGTLLVRLEGTAAGLPGRVDRLVDLLGEPAHPADGVWRRHAELVRGQPGQAVLRVGCRPSRLPALLAGLGTGAATVGLGTGVATVGMPHDGPAGGPEGEGPAGDEAIVRAHAAVAEVGGSSMLRDRPDPCTAPAWGPPPSAVAVLRAVKAELDPDDRLGPGRFAGWM